MQPVQKTMMEKIILFLMLPQLGFFSTLAFLPVACDQATNNSIHNTTSKYSTPDLRPISIPLHTAYQCNDHLSTIDCLACFDAAIAKTRNCSAGYDPFASLGDCFLRYERTNLVNAHDNGIPTAEINKVAKELLTSSPPGLNNQTMDHHNIAVGGRRIMREVGDRPSSPPPGNFGQGAPNWNSRPHNATTQHPERR